MSTWSSCSVDANFQKGKKECLVVSFCVVGIDVDDADVDDSDDDVDDDDDEK